MILFVDDDVAGTKPYQIALQDAGYNFTMAGNPDEALEVLGRSQGLQFIILDIYMPFGKQFTRAETRGGLETGIRLLDKILVEYPSVPVLVFSINNIVELSCEYVGRNVSFMAKGELPSEFVAFVREKFGPPQSGQGKS